MQNEVERQNAVSRFMELDAGIHQDLDNLVNLVAQLCDVPVALVSLIDADMQWLKASVGTGDIDCNRRDLSFCQFTIMQDDLLVITDASLDARTANLPIVANSPNIRFYAGVPLVTYDGHAVGTMCILDVKTRELSEQQKNAIKVLAKQVLNLIELNWSLQTLSHQQQQTEMQKRAIEHSELKLRAVFDSSKDIHLLIGRRLQILAFNKAAFDYILETYNYALQPNDFLFNIIDPQLQEGFLLNFGKALDGQAARVEWLLQKGQENTKWLDLSFIPVIDKDGHRIGVAVNATDVTAQKLSAEQIGMQNAALQRIATIQSHELRRPVASLLGLMEVIKLDNYTITDYFEMLEVTVNELDGKIREIVRESEITIYHQNESINA